MKEAPSSMGSEIKTKIEFVRMCPTTLLSLKTISHFCYKELAIRGFFFITSFLILVLTVACFEE
jgi:hypothetical protein